MIKNFPKVLIELKPSKQVKGGVGVFAVRNLKKGLVIGDFNLLNLHEIPEFKWNEYKKLDKETQQKVNDFSLGSSYGFSTPKDFNYLSIPWYINHSCDGNVGFDKKGNFITIKEIKTGDELNYDYGLAESNPNFKMKCLCGSKNCRKNITGNDWLNVQFRKINEKYFLPELKNKF